MMMWKPAIYVVMACAFGACAEEDSYCDRQQGSSCVCKPTMKLDMTPLESATNSICNNATFDWMVHTMLVEVSHLKEQIYVQTTEVDKQKEQAEHLVRTNTELNNILLDVKQEVEQVNREKQVLQEELDKMHLDKADLLLSQVNKDDEVARLNNLVSELNAAKNQLQVENQYLKNELEEIEIKNKKLPKDCADIQSDGARFSGVFTVHPEGAPEQGLEVFCDLHTDNGGWTVVQRRQDGSQRFDVDWATYKKGFGTVAKEFWIGNEYLHKMTNDVEYEMRIDMTDRKGNIGHAHYTHFSVGSEHANYMLYVSGYSGNVGDSMAHHDRNPFSTTDVDNDKSRSGHCSNLYGKGGWWFVRCYDANLNGQYGTDDKTGIIWFHWQEQHVSLRHVEMKIRPVAFGKKDN